MGAESSSMQNAAVTTCKGCKDYGNRQTDTVKVDLDKIRDGPVSGKENNAPVSMTKETAAQKQLRQEQEKQAAEEEAMHARALEEERLRREEQERRTEEERQRQEEAERQVREEELRRWQAQEEKRLQAEQARRAAEAERKEQARIAEERRRQAEEERLRRIQEEEARRRFEEEREKERQRQELMALEQKKARRLQEFLEDAGFQAPDEKMVKKGMISSTFHYPLHVAVEQKDVEAVELLLWAGVDPQVQNSKKQTPLALAQAKNKKGSHTKVIAALKKSGRA